MNNIQNGTQTRPVTYPPTSPQAAPACYTAQP